ncbi:MAG TPA: Rieske (2Fe-2S) protein [Beijerinckiaceae bacterium]|jgi:nitrite reductase/ring-hydroxylating ferredoxin subunit|nr:Rieske (2Fe-2S) protein [Beijerinckiaceae bacterium]
MNIATPHFVRAGTLAELKLKGRLVVHGRHRPVLVAYDNGRVFALDNRCPHMGFPLNRGSIEDGILTCHWHHARFDLTSGCTFDLWADDVPTCPVEVRGGSEVWVRPAFNEADPASHWRSRLEEGLALNLGLVIAKAVYAQLSAGVPPIDIVRQTALFGCDNRDGWSVGLTILTALGNVLPALEEREVYLALFHGARRVAADCDGEAPRRKRAALASRPELPALKKWLQNWTAVRHRDGAERTLLTAIASDTPAPALADLMVAAGSERVFADDGHVLDFINKGFECLDLIGFEHAAALLPSLVPVVVAGRGAEESTAWRHPSDLIALCQEGAGELAGLFAGKQSGSSWSDHAVLAEALLGDDPLAIVSSIEAAVLAGALPADLGRALAYAAALRVARFGNANEHADWETAHHVFTYANAVHQLLKRIAGSADPSADTEIACVILHGAMAIYLARYLNVPPARLPGEEGDALDDLPPEAEALAAALLDVFDRQRQVDAAARLVSRHLTLGHPPQNLIATLGRALLREDAGFHAYQMFEAGVRQFAEWGDSAAGRHILIAVARYLAAHSPTERSALQTSEIARRLMRGTPLHMDAD